MNALLWAFQIIAALLYAPSGIVKMFLAERMSRDFPSLHALPPSGWRAVGAVEFVCAAALILPGVFHWRTDLTVFAAAILTAESSALIASRIKHREFVTLLLSAVPGIAMAFVAYGRLLLRPMG